MPRYVPTTPEGLTQTVARLCDAAPGRLRVAVDGPSAADPAGFAKLVVERLRQEGRPAAVVDLQDYLLPASQRLEFGREDPESYRLRWFDYAALGREVLDAVGPEAEDPSWLPRLRDPATDRSVRARREQAPEGLVVLVAGPMLLGRWLDFDLSVALRMDEAVLKERTAAQERWTVPALIEHESDLFEEPDLVVRYNHADRPAVQSDAA